MFSRTLILRTNKGLELEYFSKLKILWRKNRKSSFFFLIFANGLLRVDINDGYLH